jgi:hypothetical protein
LTFDLQLQLRFQRLFEEEEEEDEREVQRINFENLKDVEFEKKFRMTKCEVEFVLGEIGGAIKHKTDMNQALSPQQQLLTTLHWYGNGAQYHGVADMHGVSQSTVCRAVHRVTEAIVNLLFDKVVTWPEDPSQLARRFQLIGN